MAIIHTDGFQWAIQPSDYTTLKGYAVGTAAGSNFSGQWPASSSILMSGSPSGSLAWRLPSPGTTFTTGFRYKGAANAVGWWVQATNVPTGNNILSASSTGTAISMNEGAGTPVLDGTAAYVDDGNWHYVEVQFVLGGTSTVRVDEVTVLTAANGQTTPLGSLQWGCAGGTNLFFQDLVILDNAAPNGSFLGDVHIELRAPSGVGSSTQWAPVGNVNNYAAVQDLTGGIHLAVTTDRDTTYVTSGVAGQRDYYTLPALTEVAPTAIYGVATYIIGDKDNTPPRGVKASVSSSGTQVDGTEFLPTMGTYGGGRVIAQVDPHTGSAWTVGAANAAQPGVVISS